MARASVRAAQLGLPPLGCAHVPGMAGIALRGLVGPPVETEDSWQRISIVNSPRILFPVSVDSLFFARRLAIGRAARDGGAKVWVAAASTGQEGQIIREGFRFVSIPFRRSGKNIFHETRTILEIAKVLRDFRPDLVHNVTIKPVLYASWLSRFIGRPTVVNAISGLGYIFIASGARERLMRGIVRMAYKAALFGDRIRIIFPNPDAIPSFVAAGMVEKDRPGLIRGSGVDVELYRPLPEQPGVPIVMFASRMLKDKGAVELGDAARLLRDWKVPFRMVFVGDPDPERPAPGTESALRTWEKEKLI